MSIAYIIVFITATFYFQVPIFNPANHAVEQIPQNLRGRWQLQVLASGFWACTLAVLGSWPWAQILSALQTFILLGLAGGQDIFFSQIYQKFNTGSRRKYDIFYAESWDTAHCHFCPCPRNQSKSPRQKWYFCGSQATETHIRLLVEPLQNLIWEPESQAEPGLGGQGHWLAV